MLIHKAGAKDGPGKNGRQKVSAIGLEKRELPHILKVKPAKVHGFFHFTEEVGRNKHVDQQRRSSTVVPKAEYIRLINEQEAQRQGMAMELLQSVNQALTGLQPNQREVVTLKIYDDLTFRDIASITGEPESTVTSRYYVALEKLKEKIRPEIK